MAQAVKQVGYHKDVALRGRPPKVAFTTSLDLRLLHTNDIIKLYVSPHLNHVVKCLYGGQVR